VTLKTPNGDVAVDLAPELARLKNRLGDLIREANA
jgi:hypothetical protein